MLSIISVITGITALQSIVIFVVVILVVCMYHKKKDTPRAVKKFNTRTEDEEVVYDIVEGDEKSFKVKKIKSYARPSK